MTLDGQAYAPRGPKRRSRARNRVHPPGAQPVQEPDGRGEPVHRRVPELIGGLPFIDRRKVRARRKELLAAIELDIAPDTPVARLSQGERQLVEIAKALGADARIVIFDEPTTSLTARESERLFAQIGRLEARGIAVIYISHILGDVMRLCDQITVLRDGHRRRQRATGRDDHRSADHAHGRPDDRPDLPAARAGRAAGYARAR